MFSVAIINPLSTEKMPVKSLLHTLPHPWHSGHSDCTPSAICPMPWPMPSFKTEVLLSKPFTHGLWRAEGQLVAS